MKPAVVFFATFAIATAASAGAKVALTKPAPPPSVRTDSTHAAKADSTKTDTALVASGQPVTPPPPDTARSVVPKPSDTSKVVAVASKLDAAVTQAGASEQAAPPAVAPPATAPVTDTVVQASERRIAKVFTAMDSKQAAKVLDHMTDNDVQIILGYVGPRQAASIMSALPPERVATLSKLAMQGKKQ